MSTTPRGAMAPLLATFTVQTMAATALFGVAVIAPVAAPDIGVDATLIGTFTAITYAFGMVAGLLTGAFADRYGAIRVCQTIMILTLVGTACLTLSTPLAAAASAAVLGLCYGPVNPVSTHILARVAPQKSRPLFFSIKQTGMPLGSALAGALLPVIVALYDWRIAILATGVMAAVVAVFIQPLRPWLDAVRDRGRSLRGGDVVEPLKLVWRAPQLRCLAVIGFAYSGTQVAITVFYVVYLTAELAMPLTTAGLIFTVFQGAAIGGRLFWGAIADRFYPANPLLAWLGISTGVFTIATGLYAPDWPLWTIVAVAFLFGITCAGWNGVFFSELVKAAPADRIGEAASGIQFTIMGGVAMVPPVFGVIVTMGGGYFAAFLALAIGMAAAAIYLKAAFRSPPSAS